MRIRVNINIKLNKLVKYLVLSDLVLLAGWGLIEPIFSIFVLESIRGATLVTVGLSAAIYWILRSLIQLPLAEFLDRSEGEKDDFYMMIVGLMIASFSAILFIFVREVWQLYLVQSLHAVGIAFYAVAWPGIFSRHLDRDKVSFEWALDSVAISIGAGISGFFGGVIAANFGFPAVFFCAAFFSLLSILVLTMIPKLQILIPKKTIAEGVPAKKEL